ncbi:MAG: [NiFe]-hydrogenase assembly chaperone HybE [Alphaproteobacteria bacterium]|jgi:[NiFe] hydrogenase assembly HybE family chaperone|nr:[NiFe]-hydrogenase assembly chaperone HybE [Alphaproteobacteria bacterium]
MTADAEKRVAALAAAFRQVDAEMRALPVYNPALAVEAVGFGPYGDDVVGVLITPWFMSLIALPGDPQAAATEPLGEKTVLSFPSGDYAFQAGEVGEGLRYRSCHLFSPIPQFADQQTAREAAEGALEALFATPPEDAPSAPESAKPEPEKRGRRALLGGRTDKTRS